VVPDLEQRPEERGVGHRLVGERGLELDLGVDDPLQRVLVVQPREVPLPKELLGHVGLGPHALREVLMTIVDVDVTSPHGR